MTSATPLPGADPVLPVRNPRPSLDDFDPAARRLLAGLDSSGIRSLAIQARATINHLDEASFTTDPEEAAREALAALRRGDELDDGREPLSEVEDSLRLAVLVLGREDELDGRDCRALAWLLDRAESLARHVHASHTEAGRRLWRATAGRDLP